LNDNKYLEVNNLSKVFRDEVGFNIHLLEDISFSAPENSIVSVLAPAGAGKSSLLKIICGLEPATNGEIKIHLNNKNIVYIPCKPSSFPWFSVKENIDFVKQGTTASKKIIELVGLEGYENHHADNRSAGFRLRISLARALAVNPGIIVLDEPFNSLNPVTKERLYEVILKIKKLNGITFILATTNLSEAVLLSDEVFVMQKNPGKIIDSVKIDLGKERKTELIKSEEFFNYRTQIERILKKNKSQLLSNITV